MIHFDFDRFQNLIHFDTKFYKIDTKLITYLGHIDLIQIEIRFCTIFFISLGHIDLIQNMIQIENIKSMRVINVRACKDVFSECIIISI